MSAPAAATAAPVLRLAAACYRHESGAAALDGVSLSIGPGEAVCVLGPNGSGKSTLLRLLAGLVLPTAGTVEAFGRALDTHVLADRGFVRELRSRLGLVFQDSDVQLFSPTVLDDAAFGPLQLGLAPREAAARAREALALLGVERLADRSPTALSGGEKKRVALAAVLASDPAVLLLDEPFAGLDPRSQAELADLLAALRARGKTVVSATHDLALVDEVAARAVLLGEDHRVAADAPLGHVLADEALLVRTNLVHPRRRAKA